LILLALLYDCKFYLYEKVFCFPIDLSSHKNPLDIIMKITVKEGWSEKSKMSIIAIMASLAAIVAVVIFD